MENQPPRILVETLSPPPQQHPREMSIICPQYRFFANVEDPDPGDTIFWRVFIDYLNDDDPLETDVEDEPPADTRRLITFSVDPQDEHFGAGDTKFEVPHSIELLISDRPFLQVERNPVARAPEDDGITASAVWPVQLIAEVDLGCVE